MKGRVAAAESNRPGDVLLRRNLGVSIRTEKLQGGKHVTTGQQSQAPWQPPPQQRQAPKRKHRGLKITLGVIGAIVLIIVIAAVASSGGGGSSASGGGSGSAAVAGIGTPVKDGKFQFTVTKVTHTHRAGGAYLNKSAQGRYTWSGWK